MEHEMRLHEEPFDLIKTDIKKVEYRLNIITFYKRPLEDELIKVKVSDLKYYDTLEDMYKDTFDLYLKDKYKTVLEAVEDTPYYSESDIKKYGCVAIFFHKI